MWVTGRVIDGMEQVNRLEIMAGYADSRTALNTYVFGEVKDRGNECLASTGIRYVIWGITLIRLPARVFPATSKLKLCAPCSFLVDGACEMIVMQRSLWIREFDLLLFIL